MKKSIIWILIPTLTALAPTLSFAQAAGGSTSKCYSREVPPGAKLIEFGDVGYWNDPARFQVGYTIPLLRYGLPIGIARSCAPSTPRSQETMPQRMARIFVEGQAHAAAISSARSEVHATIGRNPVLAAPTMTALANPRPVSASPLREFRACALDALRNLKRRLNINSSGASASPEADLALAAIATTLHAEAGRNGFPCGKGIASLEDARVHDDVEAVKALMALTARSTIQERSRLSVALALASGEGRSEELQRAWRLVWNRLSLVAIFASTALPTASAIAAEAAASSNTTTGSTSLPGTTNGSAPPTIFLVESSRSFENLPALVAEGERIALEIYERN